MDALKHKQFLTIAKLSGIGSKMMKNLISHFGSAENLLNAELEDLLRIDNIGKATAGKILSSKEEAIEIAREEFNFIEKKNIKHIPFVSKEYPNRLHYCDDSPFSLFFIGNANLNAQKIISIVGTRKVTEYGKRIIKDFLYDLKEANILVVSGLAYGVDSEVHKTCVEFNIPTVGVLAHGLDNIYPATNKNLAKKMIQNGGLLTEYFTKTNPDRQNFPTRNRIVAGLADATIIIESDKKGGSLITAEIANSYKRDVFAFPGNIQQQYSSGCNALIKQHKADLIENANDLFQTMGWQSIEAKPQSRQRKLFLELNETEQKIVQILHEEPLTADKISVKSLLPMSLIHTHLLNLELKGVVRPLPGNKFTIN